MGASPSSGVSWIDSGGGGNDGAFASVESAGRNGANEAVCGIDTWIFSPSGC